MNKTTTQTMKRLRERIDAYKEKAEVYHYLAGILFVLAGLMSLTGSVTGCL